MVDIDYGFVLIWDYYKIMYNCNGIFNDGCGVKSYVYVVFNIGSGMMGVNVVWLLLCVMVYGDGELGMCLLKFVVLVDVVGYEMSYGVIEVIVNLNYLGDVGGLNELMFDIFGMFVKFYVNNLNDFGNYVIGVCVVSGGLCKMYK